MDAQNFIKYFFFPRQFISIITVIIFVCLTISVWGKQRSNALYISAQDSSYSEGKYSFSSVLYFFTDSLENRPIEEVTSDSLQKFFMRDSLYQTTYYGGVSGENVKCVWARLTIYSHLDQGEHWLINFSSADAKLYYPLDSQNYVLYRSGISLPASEKSFQGKYGTIPVIPFYIPSKDTFDIYIQLRGTGMSIFNDLFSTFTHSIFRPEVLFEYDRRFRFLNALLLGIILSIAFYHLVIFIYQREWGALFFSLMLVNFTLILLSYGGYYQEFIIPDKELKFGIIYVAIEWTLVYLFQYLFSREYLRLNQYLPWIDKAWATVIILYTISVLISILKVRYPEFLLLKDIFPMRIAVLIRLLLIDIILLFSLFSAIFTGIKGHKGAWIYLIAMSAFAFQEIINVMPVKGWGYVPSWLINFVGQTLMVLLFAMGIARQLKELQQAKLSAEKAELTKSAEADHFREIDLFKTRFFTNVTHQFRSPITIIMGMAEQIVKHPSTWLHEGTDMIRRNGKRLLHLVDQLLRLNQLEAGNLPVEMVCDDIVPYFQNILNSFRPYARQKNIHLTFEANTQSLTMDFDPNKILDICSNLIANAIKFTPQNGSIILRLAESNTFPKRLIIEVEDDGTGIPAEVIPAIFDRFSHWGEQGGTGIGLSLTKELVELLGGNITVKSTPGKGSIFSISLPITQNATLKNEIENDTLKANIADYLDLSSPSSMPSQVSTERDFPTILIVEDHHDIAKYIKAVLKNKYQLLFGQNGMEGLQKAKEHIPDIIISDIMMPKMNGIEMCQQLKADLLTSHIPIILLTAKIDTPSRLEGWEVGADAYLSKPFNEKELHLRIQQLINARNRMQEKFRDLRFLFQTESLPNSPTTQDHLVKSLQQSIEANLSNTNLSANFLCKEIGISRSQLYKKFKAISGQTIADFIRRIRLYKAKELLENTELNVSQVSEEVGFKNLSSFSRSFSEEFGIPPSKVRNSHH
jgi:signal transduction histidine kinase/DNA-binding response OmpR family regulator